MNDFGVDFEDSSLDFYATAIHAIVYLFLYFEHNLTQNFDEQISVLNTCCMQFDVKSVSMHGSTFY